MTRPLVGSARGSTPRRPSMMMLCHDPLCPQVGQWHAAHAPLTVGQVIQLNRRTVQRRAAAAARPRWHACKACHGKGCRGTVKCARCSGTGQVHISQEKQK